MRSTHTIPQSGVIKALLLICIFGASEFLFAQSSGTDRPTVVLDATLIDGTGRTPLENSAILVEGKTIKAVGTVGSFSYPANATVIRATGQFVIPGLIDAHVHYRDWVGELFLAHGVTSIIDMGNPIDWILAQRDGIAKEKILGPRIFAAGDALGFRFPDIAPGANLPPREIESVRRQVKELIARGIDHISVTIRVDPRTYAVIAEEAHRAGIPVSVYSAYAEQAMAAGIDALQHSYSISIGSKKEGSAALETIRDESQRRNATYFQKHTMEYLMEADHDALVQSVARHRSNVIPSLIFEYKLMNDHRAEFEQENLRLLTNPNLRYVNFEDFFPQLMSYSHYGIPRLGGPGYFGTTDFAGEEFKKYQQGYRRLQDFYRKLAQAGGKILAGTDAPNIVLPGLSLHHELELLVDAGLTPMQAILAATREPATFLRKEKTVGTIEPGKLADLVILLADPLKDIRNTKQIAAVMKDGRVLDTGYHPDFSNPIPRPIFSETQRNPVPKLTEVSPKLATEGDAEAIIKLTGSDFIFASSVQFAGQRIPTVFVSDTELTARVPAPLLERVGTFPIVVVNPKPAGGSTEAVRFIVKFR